MKAASFFAFSLGACIVLALEAQAHSLMQVNDTRSPGTLGDGLLSLDEAIDVGTGRLQLFQLSPGEAAQVIQDPGRFQIDTILFDPAVFPATITLSAPLPPMDDPVGDYIDGSNFYQFPLGSITIDGSTMPAGSAAFTLQGSNTGIAGFHIRNIPGDAIRMSPDPVFGRMFGVLIQRNFIHGCGGYGVVMRNGPDSNTVWNVLVTENLIRHCAGGGISFTAGSGQSVDVDLLVEGNLLLNNGSNVFTGHGIHIEGSSAGDVEISYRIIRNQIIGQSGFGILVDGHGTGSTIGGTVEACMTAANAYGLGIYGTSLAGASNNDVSMSVRRHDSVRDVLAAVVALGGAAFDASDALLSLSLRDVSVDRGGDIAQVMIGGGSGDRNLVSVTFRNLELLHGGGDGLWIRGAESDSTAGQVVQVRGSLVRVDSPARTGMRIEGGAGATAQVSATLVGGSIDGADRGVAIAGASDSAAPGSSNSVHLELRAMEVWNQGSHGILLDARAGGTANLVLRRSSIRKNSGNGLTVSDPLGIGGVTVDLGSAVHWGLNAFVANVPCAVDASSVPLSVEARGNFWGSASGPAVAPNGNCVSGNLVTTSHLAFDPSIGLRVDPVLVAPGDAVRFDLDGEPATMATLYAGTQWLDLSTSGGLVYVDPQSPFTSPVTGGGLPFTLQLSVPVDETLVGLDLFLQALGSNTGAFSTVRSLRIR